MKKYQLKDMYRLIVLGIIVNCTPQIHAQVKSEIPPNIILIMADDLGYGELSSYGSKTIHTPNLDKLASQGVKFLDFHSNGPICSPTRAALLTGKYQQRTGVEGVITAANHREVGLSLDEITMAEELQRLGYTTAMYGKWHLGYAEPFNPIYQGFDEFKGFVSGNIDYHSHIDQEGYLDWWQNNTIADEPGYSTDLITNYGIQFIKQNHPNKTGKPFFLYLAQESPHYPIQGRYDKPVREEGNKKYIRKVPKDSVQTIYRGMIETMDETIGDLLKTVNNEGLDKNTIIIFCSDNGAAGVRGDNGVLRDSKTSVYEGGHRVPAIMKYPNHIKAGSINETPILTMDLLPTFLDFAKGTPQGKSVDGVSFKNHIVKGEAFPERDLFWVFRDKKAMRSGDWKLVTNGLDSEKTIELFNLKQDLSEQNDLSKTHPDRVKTMLKQLDVWEAQVRSGAPVVAE
ncbi:arylsulfatase [Formosa agariphila KMM 3901]|uniref:Arylsulfatase n=1 Tax=Formosa agariphila (strain DSM 15362 / KCTC 12365 / LMG 23005 / KMM 3901 / M-2Alg 35-1) TaxID=1347342 RepID=T2KJW0_FORAG|nr:sulfatase-like hydrolase/transferase [Formosa agariphila]CDF78706.1 arylsulfatase [Formosa agariphila KMM 3901]